MKQYTAPLAVFVVGEIVFLFALLLWPSFDAPVATLGAITSNLTTHAWGWSWLMTNGVVKFLVYLIFQLVILFATAKTFLATKN